MAEAGAKVILEVQPELKRLLSSLESAAAVIARGEEPPAHDLQCPLGSLPLALGTTFDSVPAPIPYLQSDDAALAKWAPRISSLPGLRVAIAWSGRATHANDRNRSLRLEQLEPLLAVPGASFISIQRDLRPGEAERLAAEDRILHLGEELEDFTDTAAVLSQVDLTICVDTSVAHLAGALGRPLWLLLPFQPDWRWTLDREHFPLVSAGAAFPPGCPRRLESYHRQSARSACVAREACYISVKFAPTIDAGWSSPVARQAHNLKVVGSNPTPATNS